MVCRRVKYSNAPVCAIPQHYFLLTRVTGIRIGECIDLALNCLRPLGQDQWALHVPLGKLHTDRWLPLDQDGRQMVNRILILRAQVSAHRLAQSVG
jgi:hypothetical protein